MQSAPFVTVEEIKSYDPREVVVCIFDMGAAYAVVARTAIAPIMTREGVISPIPGVNGLMVVDNAGSVQRIAQLVAALSKLEPRSRGASTK